MSMKKEYYWMLTSVLVLLLVFSGCAKKTVRFTPVSDEDSALAQIPSSSGVSGLPADKEGGLFEEKVEEEGLLAQQIARDFSAQPFSFGGKLGGEGGGAASPLQSVYFDFDKATLTEEAKAILSQNASWLKKNPDAKVQIEGHADERGTTEYNLALGDRRAQAVRSYLTALGISSSRLATISYGEEQPVDPGHNEAAWAQNRRAHFNILQGFSRR